MILCILERLSVFQLQLLVRSQSSNPTFASSKPHLTSPHLTSPQHSSRMRADQRSAPSIGVPAQSLLDTCPPGSHGSFHNNRFCTAMAGDDTTKDDGIQNLNPNMIGYVTHADSVLIPHTYSDASLYDDRNNADLSLICGTELFEIHSFVLYPRSTFFQAAGQGGFKVCTALQRTEGG